MERVLICDDSQFMRNILRKVLASGGHTIIGEATNGYEAIHLCLKTNPDLVILDINMPIISGIEAAKEIKKINSDIVIIMCSSSMGQSFIMRDAVYAGADGFIVKPFKAQDVIECINKIKKV